MTKTTSKHLTLRDYNYEYMGNNDKLRILAGHDRESNLPPMWSYLTEHTGAEIVIIPLPGDLRIDMKLF